MLSSKGRFYTTSGAYLLELDIEKRTWTACENPAGVPLYLSYTEGRDGTIYAGSYETCHLVAFDPATRRAADLGMMDPVEMYLSRLATDDKGWVYCGIGVARYNLVAFNPRTGERRQLVSEQERKTGTCAVSSGADGKAYGSIDGQEYVLYEGAKTLLSEGQSAPPECTGAVGWGSILNRLPDGRQVGKYSLDGKWFEISDTKTGKTRRVSIDYQSAGPNVRFIFAGPGGKVWGASGHPPWSFTFDPKTRKAEILGTARSWQAADWVGDRVYSAEYSGGWLSIFDARRPWTGEGKEAADNPRVLAEYAPDINQPYAALVHPDGVHVLMSGWPGYGYIGGGLAIYNLKTGESQLIKHTELVRDQSTYQLAVLPNGDVVAGTNISGGHGTRPVAKEGMLYILDWKTKTVSYRTVPVPGAEGVDGLVVARDGLVYAISTPPVLFVFDPKTREIVHRRELGEYGNIAYNGLRAGPDGLLYAVMTKALLRITPGTFAVQMLAEPPGPSRAGTAVVGGRLYFVIGTHLWSFALPHK
ncbi:MAG: hypothetical protein A2W03_17290 [Candidatus Aminicenantes bacterium RBG_16_63_16]|nr:MAG: hypothetical protein A2W03_17290 [Candidatus Aminicenantes bacterium RBG_16_63_16]